MNGPLLQFYKDVNILPHLFLLFIFSFCLHKFNCQLLMAKKENFDWRCEVPGGTRV